MGYRSGRTADRPGLPDWLVKEDPGSPYEPQAEPEPRLDPDALQELGDEIATLAAHLHAGRQRLLGLIARFDRHRGWEAGGHRSCAHWLVLHTGFDLGVSREHVRVAEALTELPGTEAAMARGALSFCKVRALTRIAKPENEADLLELAEGCTAPVLRQRCRAYRTCNRKDEAALERERHDSRRLALYPNGDGMYRLDALVTPETAASLDLSLHRGVFALYRESRKAGLPWDDSAREASRRRADALGMVAEWALAAGHGTAESEERAPISGTRAERWQVMLHVEPATLAREGEPGMSELADGTRLSAETARRLACDCGLVRVERSPKGEVLSVGRKTRSIPSALRRALEVRDGGCRFPGCGLRFTDGHHIFHWADGGETSLGNTLLLCRHHHRLCHEGGWTVEWWGRRRDPAFRDPNGTVHVAGARKPPRLPADPLGALVASNAERGVAPDARTAGARWKRERDIPDPVYFRTLDAAHAQPP